MSSSSSSSSSSSPSPSSLVTAMPDKQSIPTDAELEIIAPKPKLYPNNFIQFPKPGFINDIDSMPSGYWWPWPTFQDAAQDLFPDWIGSRQSLSASQIKIGYTVPINSVTIGIPVGGAAGAILGILAGGAFSRHFRLSPSKTNLTRFLFAGGFGGLFFGAGAATYCVSRYYSFFRANPNGPVFNPPLSHRQSYQGISKTGEIIRTPGLPVGLYQSPFVFIEQQEEKGALNASEAKVYRALLRKMDKEGVEAAKARNAENQKESQ